MPHGLVTVVLPTFNRARTLRRAITSVLSQTYANLELLIIDDGSTDNTAEIVGGIDDARLHYIVLPQNLGVCAARNAGIAQARGEFIAFQDSDDEWLLDKLERSIAALLSAGPASEPICAFHTKIMYVSTDNNVGLSNLVYCIPQLPGNADQAYLQREIAKGNLISTQTLILTKAAIEVVGIFDRTLANNEDWDFAFSLITKCKAVFLDAPLVIAYLQHDSISHFTRKGARSQLRIAQRISRHPEVDRKAIAHRFATIGWWLCKLGNPRAGAIVIHRALALHPGAPKALAQFAAALALVAKERLSGRRSLYTTSSFTVRSSNGKRSIKRLDA